jgi:hypothetical protein
MVRFAIQKANEGYVKGFWKFDRDTGQWVNQVDYVSDLAYAYTISEYVDAFAKASRLKQLYNEEFFIVAFANERVVKNRYKV